MELVIHMSLSRRTPCSKQSSSWAPDTSDQLFSIVVFCNPAWRNTTSQLTFSHPVCRCRRSRWQHSKVVKLLNEEHIEGLDYKWWHRTPLEHKWRNPWGLFLRYMCIKGKVIVVLTFALSPQYYMVSFKRADMWCCLCILRFGHGVKINEASMSELCNH